MWERSLSFASSTSSSVKGATKAISTAAIDTFAYIIDKSMGKSLNSGSRTAKSTARASIKVIDTLSDAGANILYATTDTATELNTDMGMMLLFVQSIVVMLLRIHIRHKKILGKLVQRV